MRWRMTTTCLCYFDYTWDNSKSVRTGEQYVNLTVIDSCERHNTGTARERFTKASNDNWLWSDVRQAILDYILPAEENYDANILHSWNGDVLEIRFEVNPTGNQKKDIQDILDIQVGAGKVKII